jgi:hypothetical protein
MRARGAASAAYAMGPPVGRAAPAGQYAGTLRQAKRSAPGKRLAPVIMAARLPRSGLAGGHNACCQSCLAGGACMINGRRRPVHRCQRLSLPAQMLGALLAVL